MSSGTRLRQLRELKASIPTLPDDGMRLLVISPDRWPADVGAAYEAAKAAGDIDRQCTLIEAQTGQRPSRTPEAIVIELRLYPGGPE